MAAKLRARSALRSTIAECLPFTGPPGATGGSDPARKVGRRVDVRLPRRTDVVAVRAEDATVPWKRLQCDTAGDALVEVATRIDRHGLTLRVTALGTDDRRNGDRRHVGSAYTRTPVLPTARPALARKLARLAALACLDPSRSTPLAPRGAQTRRIAKPTRSCSSTFTNGLERRRVPYASSRASRG